ncbi:MAG: DUF3375 domain-containing protein [Desulfovibrionaceae bacterium]|nr:DUF3375 domain-containing protein [Desulfovibrionaceae bacterium]
MSGKADLPPGRRGVWACIRALRTFTRLELRLAAQHVSRTVVDIYLAELVKSGRVAVTGSVAGRGRGPAKVCQYSLMLDSGAEAPRLNPDGTAKPPTAQSLMWLIMKIEPSFTARDLAALASTDEVRVNAESAGGYCRYLHKAGYLARMPGKEPRYRLTDNTGGHAPMVQKTRVVFDPNTNAIRWHEEIEP